MPTDLPYLERGWNPIIDHAKFTINEMEPVYTSNVCNMIVIVFPRGSLRDMIRIGRRNYLKTCRFRAWGKQRRPRTTIINQSAYVHKHRRNISLEELAKFAELQKHYHEVLQLAEDIRLQVPIYTPLANLVIKVIFEDTWYSTKSLRMKFLRWAGILETIRRFILDILQYQGIPTNYESIQIIETQYTSGEWYWNSTEGIVLMSVLNKWGYFREARRDRDSVTASSNVISRGESDRQE